MAQESVCSLFKFVIKRVISFTMDLYFSDELFILSHVSFKHIYVYIIRERERDF